MPAAILGASIAHKDVRQSRAVKLRYTPCLIAFLLATSCAEPAGTPPPTRTILTPPRYSGGGIGGTITAGNGPGKCLQGDEADAGWLSGGALLNCNANDVRLTASVSSYRVNGGAYQPLVPGNPISCGPGDIIAAAVSIDLVQNTGSPRTDIGIWIDPAGGDALSAEGSRCLQYTLAAGSNSDADGDQCGDLMPRSSVTAELDTLLFGCPQSDTNVIHVGSCVTWSQPGADEQCPVPDLGAEGFRLGSVPKTPSKCSCGGFDIPVSPLLDGTSVYGTATRRLRSLKRGSS